ncbi:hypothetical protein [Lottiidibacillus patelloidae]|nr:hypothetical protein [Lottiidibacillus patelloidae]
MRIILVFSIIAFMLLIVIQFILTEAAPVTGETSTIDIISKKI